MPTRHIFTDTWGTRDIVTVIWDSSSWHRLKTCTTTTKTFFGKTQLLIYWHDLDRLQDKAYANEFIELDKLSHVNSDMYKMYKTAVWRNAICYGVFTAVAIIKDSSSSTSMSCNLSFSADGWAFLFFVTLSTCASLKCWFMFSQVTQPLGLQKAANKRLTSTVTVWTLQGGHTSR